MQPVMLERAGCGLCLKRNQASMLNSSLRLLVLRQCVLIKGQCQRQWGRLQQLKGAPSLLL